MGRLERLAKAAGWKLIAATIAATLISTPVAMYAGYTFLLPSEMSTFYARSKFLEIIWPAAIYLALAFLASRWLTTRARVLLRLSRPISFRYAKISRRRWPYVLNSFTERLLRRGAFLFEVSTCLILFSLLYFGFTLGFIFLLWSAFTISLNLAISFAIDFRLKSLSQNYEKVADSRLISSTVVALTLSLSVLAFGAGFFRFQAVIAEPVLVLGSSGVFCGAIPLISDVGIVLARAAEGFSKFGPIVFDVEAEFVTYGAVRSISVADTAKPCIS